MRLTRLRPLWLSIALGLLLAGPLGGAPLREDFEGPEPSWRDSGGDAQYKISSHERAAGVAHSGRGCEQVRLVGNNGTYIYLSHDIPPARIISELSLGVWIKADRPGLQILARVVFPRTKDPATGQPLTTLVSGSGYTQVGSWQQLRLDNLPQQLERQVRVLRAQHGPGVDGHEALVDRVLLNVYGGPGTTTVLVDDLEVNGFVGATAGGTAAPPNGSATKGAFAERLPGADRTVPDEKTRPAAARLSGTNLMVGDHPFFPRLLEYRGEPLTLVKSLGFNGIWMATPPRPALLSEAAVVGLRIVAPPPSAGELAARSAAGPAQGIDSQFDSILAWDLGSGLSTKEFAGNKRWSQLLRSADPRSRPLICGPDSDLWNYSRNVDLLWTSRFPLGSSLGLTPYLTWLRERPQWARGGTPAWTMIQTQPSDRLVEQAALLSGGTAPRIGWQDEQFRQLVFSALASGARGICFQSSTPLDATDPATRRRVALLELMNLELDLIEPWCSGGTFVTSATGNDADMGAAVMQTDRARLVLPLPHGPFNQFVLPNPVAPATVNPLMSKKSIRNKNNQQAAKKNAQAVLHIPGVPESNEAFELSLVAFSPVSQKRGAGGIRVKLPEESRDSMVVLTQDATVKANLTRRVARTRQRAVELTRELAAMHLARVEEVQSRLAAQGHLPPDAPAWLEAARANLQQARAPATGSNEQQLFSFARRCDQLLRQIERASWELSVQPVAAPLSTALGTNFDTLPEYWQFMGEAGTAPRGTNLLPAGDFEDLQAALGSGWHYFQHPQPKDLQHPQPGLTTSVTPTADVVHGGSSALRLAVAPTNPEEPPVQVETAPMWLVSAPVQVEAGRVVLIHGWVNIPKRIVGSVDGLLILDSISGEPLAERVLQTKDWQEFSLYRAAPRSGPMTVTFALSGLGEAFLDDVTVQPIDRQVLAAASPGAAPRSTAPQTGIPSIATPQASGQQARGRAAVRPR
ncbi:MAG TPA: hypothetical protein VHY91_05540 [Pirellulales bacterium]|nr:hypothetical protein [Pirellulales bacterium]